MRIINSKVKRRLNGFIRAALEGDKWILSLRQPAFPGMTLRPADLIEALQDPHDHLPGYELTERLD